MHHDNAQFQIQVAPDLTVRAYDVTAHKHNTA
jgi:hypothetical protein